MLQDSIHWLSSLHRDELVLLFLGLIVLDAPRFALPRIVMCFWDALREAFAPARERDPAARYAHCPSVCVVLAGYNEAGTIAKAIESLPGSYPRLEIIVVDDGSLDGMGDVARRCARNYSNVQVLTRPRRSGKASAQNFALAYTQAEIVVFLDADSHLAENALWELVQPFKDPRVGCVSPAVLARNSFANLVTRLQAYEYLQCIFVGRLLLQRLGILGIASGAFMAARREIVQMVQGFDVGPPEDMDLTMRIRKAGYKVVCAPYSQCLTDVPTRWKALYRQRIRWDQSGVVRNHMRKHIDMAFPWAENFRWGNFFLLLDGWFYSVVAAYAFLFWSIFFAFRAPPDAAFLFFVLYLVALAFEIVQTATLLFYSSSPWHDARVCLVLPLVPLYQVFLLFVRIIAHTREIFWRSSFQDNFVPQHVRDATWHW